MNTIDGIVNEPNVNFVGKDGFFWWVGEVEDSKDPMGLGRVRVRVLGYYTNVRGGTTADLATKELPWATVLQHTSQPGNDGQGENSGQLQPGAIVMGFFMDGESAQMPIVIGVMRVKKDAKSRDKNVFAFTGENMEPDSTGHVNPAMYNPANPVYTVNNAAGEPTGNKLRGGDNNTVVTPGDKNAPPAAGPGSTKSIGTTPGIDGSAGNPRKPRQPKKPIPAANGVGGPWKTLEYQLGYLFEDLANHASTLVKAENGDFLDVVEGKIVSAKALTAKIQNFLSTVFTQVVAAIRQSVANLAKDLELVTLFGSVSGGVPFAVFTAIQSAVSTLLSSLCQFDQQIIGYIQDPVGAITGIVNGFLDGLIDKASLVMQGVQSVIDNIICNVQKLLDTLLKVVDTVKSIVDGVEKAKEIIDAWEKGNDIFADGADLFKKGIASLTGLMAMFIKFAQGNCDRSPDGGLDTVGWFPLFGVTHCTDEDLDAINKIRGSSKGTCGGGDGGGFLDSFFKEADPYLTQVTTFIDGAYEIHMGTPGRQATIKKSANGSTQTSIKADNAALAEKKARDKFKQEKPNGTPEEEKKYVAQAVAAATGGKGSTGSQVADAHTYAGTLTQEVHGDKCELVDGNGTINVEGDYHLKITGNCHIEVGGGFFLDATGAPQVVNKDGTPKNTKIQKHTLKFASDVDMNVVGAPFKIQATEFNLAAQSTKFTGSIFENSYASQTMSGGDLVLSGDNTINVATTHLTQLINTNPLKLAAKSGITTICHGSILTTMNPAKNDPVPGYILSNITGAAKLNFGTGYALDVITGGYSCNVKAGAWNTTVASGAASLIATAGNMTLTAPAGIMKLDAQSIFLN
ncbi:baseplate hub subunit and tail lysozyme [Synechococcus phage S-H25]|nr:baseplate hub subunit and tail lysozyme [Synechococcus phage S-H25]